MAGPLRIAFLGECMIELYEKPGEAPGTMYRTVGGDTLNAAVYCRRALGSDGSVSVHYVTRLGDDPFGREIPGFIEGEGVETSHVHLATGETTGLYAISRDPHGERSFAYWRSAAAARRLFTDGREANWHANSPGSTPSISPASRSPSCRRRAANGSSRSPAR